MITWTQGQTEPVRLTFDTDLTGYAVILHVHAFAAVDQPPILALDVTAGDLSTGAVTFTPPLEIEPGEYTADFDLTDSTGLISPGQARTQLRVIAHDDA